MINKNDAIGKIIKTVIENISQRFCQSMIVNRYTIKTGIINSADESPNQLILKALPLVLVKYLEIVVDAV